MIYDRRHPDGQSMEISKRVSLVATLEAGISSRTASPDSLRSCRRSWFSCKPGKQDHEWGDVRVPEHQERRCTHRKLRAALDSASIELVLSTCGSDVLALEHIMGIQGSVSRWLGVGGEVNVHEAYARSRTQDLGEIEGLKSN